MGGFEYGAVSGGFGEYPISAHFISGVEDGDAVAFIEQVFGCGDAGRTGADDADGFFCCGHGLRRSEELGVVGGRGSRDVRVRGWVVGFRL